MFSVIIPTLFKHPRIIQTLNELSSSSLVGEIILIDNTGKGKVLDIPKLNYILEEKNTFVNPAWNKGAKIAKFENLCILNDDIWFDWEIFKNIDEFLGDNSGIIGMSEGNFSQKVTEFKISKIPPDWKTAKGERPRGWGCCFFLKKSNWVEIPDDMLIWGGDDYLFYQKNDIPNFIFEGVNCHGEISLTSDSPEYESQFSPIKTQDMLNMKKYTQSGVIENYLLGTIWQ